jgi:hypothetical protein
MEVNEVLLARLLGEPSKLLEKMARAAHPFSVAASGCRRASEKAHLTGIPPLVANDTVAVGGLATGGALWRVELTNGGHRDTPLRNSP